MARSNSRAEPATRVCSSRCRCIVRFQYSAVVCDLVSAALQTGDAQTACGADFVGTPCGVALHGLVGGKDGEQVRVPIFISGLEIARSHGRGCHEARLSRLAGPLVLCKVLRDGKQAAQNSDKWT
jgi:hypothetical protein